MATTQLQMVNRILRRMREDTAEASNLSTNARIVSEMVADAYEEVVDEHLWESLKHPVRVDIQAGRTKYVLSRNVSQGGDARNTDKRVVNELSELLFIEGDVPQAWLYRDDSSETRESLSWLSPEALREYRSVTRQTESDFPHKFSVFPSYNPDNDTTEMVLDVWPSPRTSSLMELWFFTQPFRLETDGTTDAENLLVPTRPVFHLALMYAMNERGEELGEPGNIAERRYIDSLGAAIERDINSAQRANRYDFRRD